jgi:hypothetical protein
MDECKSSRRLQVYQPVDDKMSAVAIDSAARKWVDELEKKEAARSSVNVKTARVIVARRMNIAPGSLENIKNGRVKGVRGWVFEKIRGAVIHELESEIARLSHELETARRGGLGYSENQVEEVSSDLARLRTHFNQVKTGGANAEV